MSLSINNVYNEKSYSSLKLSESKINDKNTNKVDDNSKDTQKSHKKKQVISQQEGRFYCTYVVDDDGMKILLSKVPISQEKNENKSTDLDKSNEIESLDYKALSTSRTAFEYKKQQLHHNKSSLKDLLAALKGDLSNQSNSNKSLIFQS